MTPNTFWSIVVGISALATGWLAAIIFYETGDAP